MAAEQAKEAVTILHLSDTHMMLSEAEVALLPAADILIHSGDFTNQGTAEEYILFNRVLGALALRYATVIVVFGNHDCRHFHADWDTARSYLTNATHILVGQSATVLGLKIYGCSWYHQHTWDYQFRGAGADESLAGFDAIPADADVLVTHGPRYGVLDESDGEGYKSGSQKLAAAVAAKKPAVHLHGHIHEQYGIWEGKDGPLTVNSALASRWGEFRLLNGPHLIEALWKNAEGEKPAHWHFSAKPTPPIK